MGGCSMNFDDVFYARGLRAWTSTWGQAADATATEAELCEGTTLVSGPRLSLDAVPKQMWVAMGFIFATTQRNNTFNTRCAERQ